MLKPSLIVAITLATTRSHAFDPFTVAMGAESLGGLMGGMNEAQDAADAAYAFGDLLSELDVETTSDEELNKAVSKLNELNSKASEAKWSTQDLKDALNGELQKADTIAGKIKKLKNLIAASKRIATMMGIRSKTAEKAAHLQQININAQMLEELQGLRRDQFLASLEDKKVKAERSLYLSHLIQQEKEHAQSFQKRGTR